MPWIARLLRDEDAATAVEYAVMLALILMAVMSAVGTVGARSGGMWGSIQGHLSALGF